jgi:Relaxase/Mobilisation nuclease domain
MLTTIGRINKESNFAEVFRCLFNPEKDYSILLRSQGCHGDDFSELAREFQKVAYLRPITRLPVRHIFLSFADPEREISKDLKISIVDRVIQKMGFENCQYIAVELNSYDLYYSTDRSRTGIHIVANGVNLQGRKVVDFKDAQKLEEVLQEIQTSLKID